MHITYSYLLSTKLRSVIDAKDVHHCDHRQCNCLNAFCDGSICNHCQQLQYRALCIHNCKVLMSINVVFIEKCACGLLVVVRRVLVKGQLENLCVYTTSR